jgi:hypothetical protein
MSQTSPDVLSRKGFVCEVGILAISFAWFESLRKYKFSDPLMRMVPPMPWLICFRGVFLSLSLLRFGFLAALHMWLIYSFLWICILPVIPFWCLFVMAYQYSAAS